MAQKVFEIEGMSCGHCVGKVEDLLAKIDGIEQIEIDLNNSMVNLEFKEEQINEILIKRIFNKNGSYTLK